MWWLGHSELWQAHPSTQRDHFGTHAQYAEVHPGLEGQKWQDHPEHTCSLWEVWPSRRRQLGTWFWRTRRCLWGLLERREKPHKLRKKPNLSRTGWLCRGSPARAGYVLWDPCCLTGALTTTEVPLNGSHAAAWGKQANTNNARSPVPCHCCGSYQRCGGDCLWRRYG